MCIRDRIVDDGAVAGPSRVEVFHDDEVEEADEQPAPFSTELLKVTREGSTRNSGIIDQHRFRVRIDTRRIFNGNRDINDVLVAVIHSVIEQVREVVTYREYTLRAGFLFTDRNGGQFHIRIPHEEISRPNLAQYLSDRFLELFQSGDQAMLDDFIVDVQICHNPEGNGPIDPSSVNFIHPYVNKVHLSIYNDNREITTSVGCWFRAIAAVSYTHHHVPVSYTHLRAHETPEHLVCRLLLEK